MVTVEKDVRLLVKKELATVNEDFPLFASAYEGWAKVRAALEKKGGKIGMILKKEIIEHNRFLRTPKLLHFPIIKMMFQ